MILKELFREHDDVVTLTCDARICDAAEMMRSKKIGSVVIVEDQKVVGIITDRDIALAVALGSATPDSFVSESMSRDVETIPDAMSLLDATRHIRSARVKRLPVVDVNDRLVGIVSADDIMAILAREIFDTCSILEPKLGHFV